MKTFTNCAEKKAKQFLNLLQGYTKGIRMTAILVLLLMGVSNAWADNCGFWGDGAASITITVDGTDKTPSDLNSNGVSDYELGTVTTSLTIKSAWAKVWGKDQFNGIKLYYRVKGKDASSSTSYTGVSLSWGNNFNSNDQYWENTNINKSISINLAPGDYEIEYYFMADAKSESDKYLSNGSGNYHANFTIPSKKLSVAAFPNSNTVSGNKTGITVGTEYTITATPASGYKFNKWTATNGAASVTITNASSASTKVTFKNYSNDATVTAEFVTTSSKVVYLKPTGYWDSASPRFVAHVWNNSTSKDIVMDPIGCASMPDYYTCEIPAGYHSMLFFREKSDGSEQWNKTTDLTIPTNNNTCYTISSTGDGMNTGASGSWGTYSVPTYTVTLVADSHGTYNVTSGGTTKTSKLSGDVTMSVALNSKITITTNTPQPGYDQSQGAAITIGTNDKQKATLGTEYTICGPTTITGNFVTTEEQVVYLQPTGHWNGNNAQYKAFVFHDYGSKWMSNLMTNVTCETDDQACYTCTLPAGYHSVIFCRVKDNSVTSFESANLWNQTNDLLIPVNSENNCYQITAIGDKAQGEKSSGKWKAFTTPTYPLTLQATPYGEYTVKCNGVSHTSSRTKDIVIDLPVGATVEITKAESYDAAYNSDLVIKTSSNSQYEAADLNTTYTLCGATTIEENFTTTAAHVVYLRVAPSAAAEWNENGNKNYIYCTNRLTNKVVAMEAVAAGNSEINQETGYNYFKATIPAGYRAFRFERKTSESAGTDTYTEYFEHLLPLGQSNCFTIKGKNISLGTFYGDWALGTADGDYRILYVEQQVAHGTDENDWKTVINTTYQHASDIIKKGDGETIVSLHIKYDKTKHPEVILQKFTGGKWVDVEGQAHMVLSPLTASADMAMLPGRRNTEGDANLRYGDGIEEIKADAETGIEGRVWNFVVQQSGASAYINFNANDFAPYTGNYYIRTDNAAGGWMTYAIPGNVMSHSEYSLEHSGYSHYFCKWVDKKDQDDPEDKIYTPNVKFVVANDYGAVISDTIASDIYTDENGTLEADANVRWMWNEYTNIGSRAYIAGSSVYNFLVAKYVSTESQDKTGNFKDMDDWVYEADLKNVQIDDKLTSITATYDEKFQELLEQKFIDENGGLVMLTSTGGARTTYTVRVIYDFKINKTIVYLIPTTQAVTTSIDVIIERINQDEAGEATQVTAAITPADKEKGLTVYGVITLTKDHITDSEKSEQETLTYWISFPFDVKIGDITGFGEVGKHWMIKYYDGAERAAKGWFLDTKTFWKFFLDTEDVMKANTGYVLTLNKSLLNASNPVYDNTETLRLYFPSMNKIKDDITSGWTETSVTLDPLECTITSPADRRVKDSHWNLIGVPSYAHKTNNKSVKFFYDYDFKKDAYSAEMNAGPEIFHAMHAYMVQFAGTINWSTFTTTPAQLAAKKNTDVEEQYTLRLELQQNGTKADQTFVELHDDATTMFDMNVDLTKMFNASSANIYTLIGSDNQVAANVMPIANTTIPVGVQIAKAGEYTFAMPDGTDGITVELIDYETNTTTNLLLSEYNVSLPAGTFENRFALIVKPNKVATDMETIDDETNGVKKYIIDGKLFLQKDGMLYDAQGHIVR